MIVKKYRFLSVSDIDECEKELKKQFDALYTNRKDIRREYYLGDVAKMQKTFIQVCSLYQTK